MITSTEIVSVPPNDSDDVSLEQTVPNKGEKRSFDENPDKNLDGTDEERKKLKISDDSDNGNSNDKPALSKTQLKKVQKQQKWLDAKSKRK